jgi:hypothetical protein
MQFDNPFEVVRTLDGPALKVFLVLLLMQKQGMPAPGEDELQAYSGKSQNTVRKGLDQLRIYQMVRNNGRYWVLENWAVQLPIAAALLDGGDKSSQYLTRKEHTTTTYLHSRESENNEAAEENESIFDSECAQNLRILHRVGIRGKKAEQLARLAHVNPVYIEAHVEYANQRGDGIGLLITRINDGDPAPVVRHPQGCQCSDCRKKYSGGEYAEYINS